MAEHDLQATRPPHHARELVTSRQASNTQTNGQGPTLHHAALTPWLIWKQRNECMSNGAQPSVVNLVARIKDEAALWARAGLPGFRVVLSTTWGVH